MFQIGSELVTEQKHGQDEVGLLDDLVAVDRQGMEIQKQWIFVGRCPVEIPALLLQELFVLGRDLESLIIMDVHAIGGLLPFRHLGGVEPCLMH